MVENYLSEHLNDWNESSSFLLLQHREMVNTSLGFSSAEIMFSRQIHDPLYLAWEVWENPEGPKIVEQKDVVTYMQELRD